MKGDRERCLAAGMDGYVSKPIRDEDLWQAIREVLPARAGHVPVPGPLPQTLPAAGPHEVLDRSVMLARVGGNPETLRQLAGVFEQDCTTLMADLEAAVAAGDPPKLRTAAHTLKGMIAFFAQGPAADAALRLEQMGGTDDLADAAGELAVLRQHLDQVRAALAEVCHEFAGSVATAGR